MTLNFILDVTSRQTLIGRGGGDWGFIRSIDSTSNFVINYRVGDRPLIVCVYAQSVTRQYYIVVLSNICDGTKIGRGELYVQSESEMP